MFKAQARTNSRLAALTPSRVFVVLGGPVALSGITISEGVADGGAFALPSCGGGILDDQSRRYLSMICPLNGFERSRLLWRHQIPGTCSRFDVPYGPSNLEFLEVVQSCSSVGEPMGLLCRSQLQ
jgi:hypothetical protein